MRPLPESPATLFTMERRSSGWETSGDWEAADRAGGRAAVVAAPEVRPGLPGVTVAPPAGGVDGDELPPPKN